jgi:ribosomal protein S12 methylthiotransferase
MKRPAAQERTLDRFAAWRTIVPDLAIRSSFIVGFPGETERDFQDLLDWMTEARLDRAGAFKYEAVRGAKANELPGAVAEELKQERWNRLMAHQQAIAAKIQKARVGRRVPVIIDEVGPTVAKGRTKWDAPEIDGAVHVASHRPLRVGDIVTVKIEAADAYDLKGTAVG